MIKEPPGVPATTLDRTQSQPALITQEGLELL
jgi:hypothetical protein